MQGKIARAFASTGKVPNDKWSEEVRAIAEPLHCPVSSTFGATDMPAKPAFPVT